MQLHLTPISRVNRSISAPRHARFAAVLIVAAVVLCPYQAFAQIPEASRPIQTASAPGDATRAPGITASRQPAGDSLRNGTLIGMSVGFAAGFFGFAAYNAKETASGPIWDSEAIGYYTSAGLLGAGIGAGLGAIIDALNKDRRSPISKQRLTINPVLQQHRRGVAASVKF